MNCIWIFWQIYNCCNLAVFECCAIGNYLIFQHANYFAIIKIKLGCASTGPKRRSPNGSGWNKPEIMINRTRPNCLKNNPKQVQDKPEFYTKESRIIVIGIWAIFFIEKCGHHSWLWAIARAGCIENVFHSWKSIKSRVLFKDGYIVHKNKVVEKTATTYYMLVVLRSVVRISVRRNCADFEILRQHIWWPRFVCYAWDNWKSYPPVLKQTCGSLETEMRFQKKN
jgi:hypothetical protein